MATPTDTLFASRLQNVLPDNFMTNRATTFQATANLIDNMINRIGRTVITGQPSAYNPFDKWTQAVMDYGDTIQQYTLPYIAGREFDPNPDEPNPWKTVKQDVKAQYWKIDDSIQYKQTLYNYEVKKAFTNGDTFGNFVSTITNNMYESIGIDMFLKWKKYLSTDGYVTATGKIELDADTTSEAGQDAYGMSLWKNIKDVVTNKLKYPSTNYNQMGFLTSSPAVDVVITTEAKNMMDNALAGVYNVDKIVPRGLNFIEIDSFATVTGAETTPLDAVVLTAGMAKYTPRTPESGSLYNPENLNTNLWYTEQGIFSIDYSKNAVQFYRATA